MTIIKQVDVSYVRSAFDGWSRCDRAYSFQDCLWRLACMNHVMTGGAQRTEISYRIYLIFPTNARVWLEVTHVD